MDTYLQELHKKYALRAGKDRSCGNKVDYKSYETANKTALKLSVKFKKEMEAYPCPYCDGWHIGRKLSTDELYEE